ncbi:alpha/beta fold hydrolase [Actomonas aquatica]|uniref:Alpha/beta hydrolase n=1 Tax=Actomonas aquatica TaxID=2866162 RepID=A0ABZ1CEF4_9BACT|nr:alpha/beta hydrolase [Opitutus sp. WL0086]WRQ89677.1 alpha/beta hydrolase [Opitutus sp. WL0086]
MLIRNFWLCRSLGLGLAGLLVLGGLVWGWQWFIAQPLYIPGRLAERNIESFAKSDPEGPRRWITGDGVEIFHQIIGSGKPVIVLHGGPGHPFAEPWPALVSLGNRYQFAFYDQRGCGRSSHPVERPVGDNPFEQIAYLDKTLGIATQLADLERVRRELVGEGDEPVVLIGHSFGGFLAAMYAAEFPPYVEALVLVAPADVLVFPSEEGDLFERVAARLPAQTTAEFKSYMENYLDFPAHLGRSETEMRQLNITFANYYLASLGQPPLPRHQQEWTGGWLAQALYIGLGQRHDYTKALGRISAPCLVLHGSADMILPQSSARYAQLIPRAKFTVIEGAGHHVFADRPEAFANRVEVFLDDLTK